MLMEFTFVNLIEEPGTPRTSLCCDLRWFSAEFSRITCDFLSTTLQQTGVQRHWGRALQEEAQCKAGVGSLETAHLQGMLFFPAGRRAFEEMRKPINNACFLYIRKSRSVLPWSLVVSAASSQPGWAGTPL